MLYKRLLNAICVALMLPLLIAVVALDNGTLDTPKVWWLIAAAFLLSASCALIDEFKKRHN